jgi:mRNA interferase MazF
MVIMEYIPDRGDIVWITLNPQAGHEQAGRRPALILTPKTYNQKVGLAILCPITSQIKGYPFEVVLAGDIPVQGAVLSDQVKNLDWRIRKAEYACSLGKTQLLEVMQKLHVLLDLP